MNIELNDEELIDCVCGLSRLMYAKRELLAIGLPADLKAACVACHNDYVKLINKLRPLYMSAAQCAACPVEEVQI